MTTIEEISKKFTLLQEPRVTRKGMVLNVVPLSTPGNCYLGKDEGGGVVFLLETQDTLGHRLPETRLEYLIIDPNRACILNINRKTVQKELYSITFKGIDASLKTIFLRVISVVLEGISEQRTRLEVASLVQQVLDLFRTLESPPKKTLLGLWSELFLLNLSSDIDLLLSAWHPRTMDLYDFSLGVESLEVKASLRDERIHRFSFEQVNPETGRKVLVASVLTKEHRNGKTVDELAELIRKKIKSSDLRLKFERILLATLGNTWKTSDQIAFDDSLALRTLRFYSTSDIPRVSQVLGPGIANVRFDSSLMLCEPIPAQSRKRSSIVRLISSAR